MEDFKPAPLFMIRDLETLKVVADPLRNQIIEVLIPGPKTTNQIADKLGLAASKLYYHLNMLEKYDLVKVVDTTQKANIIEKHYWVTAVDYDVDKDLLNFSTREGQENVAAMMVAPIETTREDILRSLEARAFNLEHGAEAHPRCVMIVRELSHLSDEQAREFMGRLKELSKEFAAADAPGKDSQMHALAIALYPSFYYEGAEPGLGRVGEE